MKALFSLMPLLLIACAPLHVPQPPQTAMLDGAHDGHVRLNSGLQGSQLDVAYAPIDHLGVRGAAHGDIVFTRHGMVTAGVGTFVHPGVVRLGAWADAGIGAGNASVTTDIDIFTDTPPTTHRLSARLHQASFTLEGGLDWEPVSVGLSVRGNQLWAKHRKLSDEQGTSSLLTVEPIFHTRVGGGPVSFVGHSGLMVPLKLVGDVGVPMPIVLGAGVEFDLGS